MVNLIDRAGLLNQLCEKCGGGCDDDKEKRCWKYKLIMEQSTIEPEVRRGRWSECWHDERIYSGICSSCEKASIRPVDSESLKFCPKCGAKMDGGADNG